MEAQRPIPPEFNLDSLIHKEAYAEALTQINYLQGRESNSSLQSSLLNVKKANVYTLLKLHDSAIYYLETSLKEAIRQKDSNLIAKAYNNLGILLNQINRPEEALVKFRAHYNYVTTLESSRHTQRPIIANYNLGLTFYKLQQLDSAKYYLNTGLKLAKDKADNYAISKIEGLLSQVKFKEESPWSDHLQRALKASNKIKDTIGLLKAYLTFSEFYAMRKSFSKAKEYHRKTEPYLKNIKNNDLLSKFYKIKYKLHKQNGEHQQSLEALEQLNFYQQQIYDSNNANDINIFNERLKLYEQKLKNFQLLITAQTRVKNLTIITSILSIALLFILAIYILKRYRNHYIRSLFIINKLYDINKKISTDALSFDMKKLFEQIDSKINSEALYLQSDFNLSKLSDAVGSNTSYVSKVINLYTDSNFSAYMNKKRVYYSKTLIESSATAKEYPNFDFIAENSGFNSKTHFYRVFKNITGLTPKDYYKLSSKGHTMK